MVQLKRLGRTIGMPIVAGGGAPSFTGFGPEEFNDFTFPILGSKGALVNLEDFNDFAFPVLGVKGTLIHLEDFDDFT